MALNYGSALNTDNSIAYRPWLFDENQLVVPVITLVGSGVTVNLNDSYVEPGYSATDAVDGDLTGSVVVTGSVDTATAGVYTLRYNVTNSVGNSATEVIRLVTVIDFWETTPPQSRIVDMESGYRSVIRDPDSTLSYWLDMSDLVGGQTISSLTITNDAGVTVNCTGINSVLKTDNNGTQYAIGTLIGLCISGGTSNGIYDVTARYTLSGGDIDDRTLRVHVIET